MDDYTLFSRRRLVPYGQSYAPESGGRFEQGAMRIRQMQRAQEQAVRRAAEIAAEARPLTVRPSYEPVVDEEYGPKVKSTLRAENLYKPVPKMGNTQPRVELPSIMTDRGLTPPPTFNIGNKNSPTLPSFAYAHRLEPIAPQSSVDRAIATAKGIPQQVYKAVTSPAATAKAVANAVLSGEDYQSTGEPVVQNGVINWGDPDNPADFFRADAALQELHPYREEGFAGGGKAVKSVIDEVLALIRKARPEQMRRAREQGFDTRKMYLHGTQTSPEEIKPNFYISRDPEIADIYARRGEHLLPEGEIPEGAAVMPVLIKKGAAIPGRPLTGYFSVRDPSDVRSVFAEFDPLKKDSSNIMSSAAAAAAALGAASQYEGNADYASGGHVEPETPPEPTDEGYSNGGIVSGLLNEVADFVNPGFAGGGEVEGEYDYVEPEMVYDDEYDYVEPEMVFDDEYDYVEPELVEDLDGFAEGGPVLLQDEYPTEYLPEVGRQVMADGGPAEDMFDVDMTPEQARQRTVANIQPREGEEVRADGAGVPEYDALAADATYDEAAKKNLDQDIIDYEASMARIAQQPKAIRQMTHAPQKPTRPVMLSTGFGDYNLGSESYDVAAAKQSLLNTLYGVKTVPVYLTPAAPVALASDTVEAALNAIKNYKKGDYIGAAAEVGLGVAPGAAVYRKPLANAVRTARDVLTSKPVVAGATGAAVMYPDDAEAANILKALKAIRAYHGSPHKFDKFDISKIGTGEGAQAYGHGLYFAENEGVARAYRDALSSRGAVVGGKPIDTWMRPDEALKIWDKESLAAGIPEDVRRAVKSKLSSGLGGAAILDDLTVDFYGDHLKEVARILQPNKGHMYEVGIHADPSKLLDLDKPLLEQGRAVREIIEQFYKNKPNSNEMLWRAAPNGEEINLSKLPDQERAITEKTLKKMGYGVIKPRWQHEITQGPKDLVTKNDPVEVAKQLKGAGIPGIKYLDAGSRAAGEGSSNYVVFDPSIVEILRRYAHGGPVEERKGYAGGQAVTKAVKAAKQLFKGSDLIKKDPAAATAKLSNWTPSGDADFGQALKNYEYSSTKKGDLQPWKEFDPEQAYKEGALLAGILGDRSAAGRIVDAINGVKLSTPVDLRGGGEFQRSLEGPEVWASRPSAVKNMQTRIRKNLENLKADPDNPLYAAMVLMGNPAIDSTQMMAKAMLRQIEATRNKIDPKAAEELDALIRKRHPDWPGVLSPVDAERWLAKNEVGKRTSSILQAFDKSGRQAGGLPSLGAARFAMMDPRLVTADQGSTGFVVSRLDPKGATNVAAHDTYPTGMLGPTQSSADYLGGTKYQVPLQVMFPDWFKTVTPTYLDTRSGLMMKTSPVMIQQSVMTQVPVQRATQEWLDNIMKHYERNPKPWGYAHGGPVEERDGYAGGSTVVSKALRAIRELMEGAKNLPEKERMMVVHKTRPSSLELYEKLGGMPAPSTAVIKPSEPLTHFGNITLVGDPEKLAIPGARNPIFASDAYTPRMPEIFFKNDKPYFEIYNKYGEPSTRKATIQSVLRQMKSSGIRGGENFGGSEGSIRSQITPEFRNVNELAAARSRLNSDAYEEAKYRSNYMDIYRRMRAASLWKESDPGKDLETVASVARRYGGLDPRSIMGELGRNYTIDKDFASDVANYLKGLRDMPAPYFEGKPQRVVPLSDFSGALIPEGRNARNAADILNRQGVKNIEFYSPKQDIGDGAVERQLYDTLIERFPNQQFAHGGPVEE